MKSARVWLGALATVAGVGLYLALTAGGTALPLPEGISPSSPPSVVVRESRTASGDLPDQPDSADLPNPSANGTNTPSLIRATSPLLPGLHNANSAREAMRLIALQPDGPASVGHQRDLERLCLQARREGRRQRDAPAAESWYSAQLALRREWCADLPAIDADPESVERALLALGPDRGDLLREQLGRSAGALGIRTAQQAMAQSRDLYELTAALQHLDAEGALGVPPYSLRAELPAQLADLSGIAAQWTLCAEAGPCGPRSWPVLRYCAERNSCPPDADYYTAVRLSLGAVQYEQLQWLTRRIAAERASRGRSR